MVQLPRQWYDAVVMLMVAWSRSERRRIRIRVRVSIILVALDFVVSVFCVFDRKLKIVV
jgi:hypothetical protein